MRGELIGRHDGETRRELVHGREHGVIVPGDAFAGGEKTGDGGVTDPVEVALDGVLSTKPTPLLPKAGATQGGLGR